jgi:tetratricopeptide (TPR) repeat protein
MLAFLLGATALVFSPALFAGFVRLDDYSHLFENPHLQRMSVSGLAGLWTKSYFNLYIPITYSCWWAVTMVGSLFGPLRQDAWLFHALNLAVHLANAALVFYLLRTLLSLGRQKTATQGDAADSKVALLSALLFALHPVQVEAVAWISELKGVLSTMFGLLGLLCYYRCRAGKRALTAACFVAAMLAKPSAVVFPGIVLLVNRILLGMSLRKSAVAPALYGLLLLPLLLVTKHLQPDTTLDFIPTASQRLAVAADALTFYFNKVLVPFPLAVDYGRSPQYVLAYLPGWRMALLAFLSMAGLAVVVKALLRPPRGWYSLVACGWSIFLLSIAPVLGLVPFGFQDFSTVADHYLYVPLLGVSVSVAGVLVRLSAFAKSSQVVAAAVLVVFAALSFAQARLWRSTESLFAQTMKVNPKSYLGPEAVAEEHLHAGRFDQAIEWSAKALSAHPAYLSAQVTHGLALAQKGEIAKAIDHYESALARNPSIVGTRARHVASLHNNLGMVLLRVGRYAEGIDHFRKAVEIFPRSLNAHLNLGNVALQDQRYSEAISEYEIARGISPGNPLVERRLELARQGSRAAGASQAPSP